MCLAQLWQRQAAAVRSDSEDDVLRPDWQLQEFCPPGWVLFRGEVLLVVEVVDEAGDAPLLPYTCRIFPIAVWPSMVYNMGQET